MSQIAKCFFPKFQNEVAKCICINCKMYLSQIAKCICLKLQNVFVSNWKLHNVFVLNFEIYLSNFQKFMACSYHPMPVHHIVITLCMFEKLWSTACIYVITLCGSSLRRICLKEILAYSYPPYCNDGISIAPPTIGPNYFTQRCKKQFE